MLPTTFSGPVPLLTVGLDQGSIGAAGMAYAINHRGYLVYARFDKLHRVVRDMKLSLTHCLKGVFMKAQLFTAYIWGLNYRPYGTGAFFQTKRMMVNSFIEAVDETGAVFLKYAPRIAKDLGLKCDTEEDRQHVWARAFDSSSFHRQGTYPKMGRWFSWNQVASEQIHEFWVLCMVLEHHLSPSEGAVDDTAFDVSALHDAGSFGLRMALSSSSVVRRRRRRRREPHKPPPPDVELASSVRIAMPIGRARRPCARPSAGAIDPSRPAVRPQARPRAWALTSWKTGTMGQAGPSRRRRS